MQEFHFSVPASIKLETDTSLIRESFHTNPGRMVHFNYYKCIGYFKNNTCVFLRANKNILLTCFKIFVSNNFRNHMRIIIF